MYVFARQVSGFILEISWFLGGIFVDVARVDITLQNLNRHEFEAVFFPQIEEAVRWVDQRIPDFSLVSVGGSVTVRNSGLLERLQERQITILDHWRPGQTQAEQQEIFEKGLQADAYLCSANAITEDGYILNVDGRGNRVAAHCYGPKHLYLLAGINKIVPDIVTALDRVQQAAVQNCRAKGFKTPCVETGVCCDCDSSDRSCRAYLLLRRPTRAVPVTVVLIGQTLGM